MGHEMKTIFFLTLLLIFSCRTEADQDVLAYLYEPALAETQQLMAQRMQLHARNAEFDAAIARSQDLLDSVDPLRDANPTTYGQVMINHGTLRCAAGEYQLGLSIINRGMEFLESRTNPFDEMLINGVMAKGICQLQVGSLTDAEDTFRRAQHITHRQKGVYNKDQLPMISYLTAANLRQRDPLAADQQQRFSLKIAVQSYGPDSIEILPTLARLGGYFASRGNTIPLASDTELRLQRSILFKDSINMYRRAIEIIEINYGANDLRLLTPLRGLASARMFEITQRRYAEAALLRSLEIVDSNPNSDLTDRAQAMVDLGDLYIITSDERAQQTYLNAWEILQETPKTQQLAATLFGSPIRLYPTIAPFLYLNRTPNAVDPSDELFIDLQYDVSPDGRATNIEVIEKNVPNEQVRLLRATLRASRYRPRILNGELVSTDALEIHQLFMVINEKPEPDEKQAEEASAPSKDALPEKVTPEEAVAPKEAEAPEEAVAPKEAEAPEEAVAPVASALAPTPLTPLAVEEILATDAFPSIGQ